MPIKKIFMWRPRRPKMLDMYILGEVTAPFLGSCIFIILFLLMLQVFRLAEFFIIHGASITLLAKISFFMSMSFLPMAIPLAFLISVLLGFGRLSADSELIALKASGFSLTRLSIPVGIFALVTTCCSLALNMSWVPWAETSAKKTELIVGNTRVVSTIKEGTFTSFFNLLLFADKADSNKNKLYNVFIYDEREAGNPLTYIAREAEIVPVKTDDLGVAIMLQLFDGSMHHNDLETRTYEKMDYKVYHLYLKLEGGQHGAIQKPQMIPYQELLARIKTTTTETYDGREMRGELWRRISISISPLVFVFLGIGLGSFRSRTAKSGAIFTGLLVLIFYWLIQTGGIVSIQRGILPAYLALQLPNLVMLSLGLFFYRRATW